MGWCAGFSHIVSHCRRACKQVMPSTTTNSSLFVCIVALLAQPASKSKFEPLSVLQLCHLRNEGILSTHGWQPALVEAHIPWLVAQRPAIVPLAIVDGVVAGIIHHLCCCGLCAVDEVIPYVG